MLGGGLGRGEVWVWVPGGAVRRPEVRGKPGWREGDEGPELEMGGGGGGGRG